MHDHQVLIFVALMVFLFGLVSKVSERWYISGPMVFVAIGVLVGPLGLDVFTLHVDADTVKLIAEITGTLPVGGAPILAAMRNAHLMGVKSSYNDVHSRLQRARAGFRGPDPVSVPTEVFNDKDAEAGMPKQVIESVVERKPWEVFGSISYFTADSDEQTVGTASLLS